MRVGIEVGGTFTDLVKLRIDSYGLAKYSKAIPLMNSDDFSSSLQLDADTPTAYAPAKN